MYCRNCGNKLQDRARFCDKCGASVSDEEPKKQTGNENEEEKISADIPAVETPPKKISVQMRKERKRKKKAGRTSEPKWKRRCRFSLKLILALIVIMCLLVVLSYYRIVDIPAVNAIMGALGIEKKDTIVVELDEFDVKSVKVEHPDADAYYENHSDVLDKIPVKESADIMTEKEAVAFLESRGFTDMPVTWDYDMDGTYLRENEAAGTDEKHPMYGTYYMSDAEAFWTIAVVGGTIMANPVSYNLESGHEVPVMISESEEIMSYDSQKNQFYRTKPYESEIVTCVVERIDAEQLDLLTAEEIEKIWE